MTVTAASISPINSAEYRAIAQFNKAVADLIVLNTLTTELKLDYTALLADVTAIRTAVLAITAKLDADGGVTDTDYAATTNPAALTATTIAAASPSATTDTITNSITSAVIV